MPASHRIQGRDVTLPVEVRDASSATATFLVSARAARRLLPGPEIDVVEPLPGRALLALGAIDYRDNDLGDYDEVSIALFVRERAAGRGVPFLGPLVDFARGRVCTYIHRLPVNQSFTCEAGRAIWGFPKTVEEITFEHGSSRARCRLVVEGKHALTFSAPCGGTRTLPESTLTTYTYIDGAPHRVAFTSASEEVGFALGGAEVELGTGTIADELRALGLPKRALMTTWMGRMRMRFGAPEKL